MSKHHSVHSFKKQNLKGITPESWACIDCGINTAPGFPSRTQMEQFFAADWNDQGITYTIDDWSEVYMVKPAVWKAAGMNADQKGGFGDTDGDSGCLCIGCLEKRIGRTLVPRDFLRNHPFHSLPGTKRLLARRDSV
jgi:hypothetical protein